MILSPEQFDFEKFNGIGFQTQKAGSHSYRGKKVEYKDIITAFDIETTTIPDYEQAVMYVWQWQFGNDVTVMGRTWEQLDVFIERLISGLGENQMLVCFCHNLSYEFQFLRILGEWEQDSVFAVDSRKVLKATMRGHIEFRCSYLHSNMSLAEYTNKMDVEHKKLDGQEFDYRKERYWFTPLTEREKEYCQNDVLGLIEAIQKEMEIDHDDLYTFPLTSTGYVRRNVRRAMWSKRSAVQKIVPDITVYDALREAFRGGNTHANRYFTGEILYNVKSVDISSSYPSQQCLELFPMSEWKEEKDVTPKDIENMMIDKRALLFRVAFLNIHLIDEYWGCPYISVDKSRNIRDEITDNGRITNAKYLEMTITDIDYKILLDTYEWDNMKVIDCWSARYGYLPLELRDEVGRYFVDKTELKGVDGMEVYYVKAKNLLNSVYGMSAQNVCKQSILYKGGFEPFEEDNKNREEILAENNKKAFFSYTWGVWTTALARQALHRGMRIVHDTPNAHFVYCDTDSVKFIGNVDFSEYNKNRMTLAKKFKVNDPKAAKGYRYLACAQDPKGNWHYMGVYEDDAEYDEFITMGAKKYAYILKGAPTITVMQKDGQQVEQRKVGVTVSGVCKDVYFRNERGKETTQIKEVGGGYELMEHGGLSAFKVGMLFEEAGGTASVYNDCPAMEYVMIDGHKVRIGPNTVIKDSTYRLGYSKDYLNLINSLDRLGFWI